MKSLEIKNYKNLKNFKVDSLSRVNLIVGKNNVGKSTLLEAISIFAAGGDINWLKRVLEIRGINSRFPMDTEDAPKKEKIAFETFYYNMNRNDYFFDVPIEIMAEKEVFIGNYISTVSLKFVHVVDIYDKDENGNSTRTRKILDNDDIIDNSISDIMTGIFSVVDNKHSLYVFSGGRSMRNVSDKLMPYKYIRTSQIISEENPMLFDNIALSPTQNKLIEALHIIDSRIEDINFLKDDSYRNSIREDSRIPIVVFYGSTDRHRLSTMGDGINRILTIVLALLNCKDGVLLIDEFENGLHYSVQKQLWQMIYKLAEELNVQVFATTHSDDCIKSFIEADEKQLGKLIRLENRDGDIVTVEYDEQDELQYISTNKTEVR